MDSFFLQIFQFNPYRPLPPLPGSKEAKEHMNFLGDFMTTKIGDLQRKIDFRYGSRNHSSNNLNNFD